MNFVRISPDLEVEAALDKIVADLGEEIVKQREGVRWSNAFHRALNLMNLEAPIQCLRRRLLKTPFPRPRFPWTRKLTRRCLAPTTLPRFNGNAAVFNT